MKIHLFFFFCLNNFLKLANEHNQRKLNGDSIFSGFAHRVEIVTVRQHRNTHLGGCHSVVVSVGAHIKALNLHINQYKD